VGTVVEIRAYKRDDAPVVQPVDRPAREGTRRLIRGPELGELRALCAAADLGSISRAAGRLGVSQPALSKRLRVLEAVAGTALLERSTRGVTLTFAGERLYGAARRLLSEAESVEALMCELTDQSAPVRVAASPTVAEQWLPELLVDLQVASERLLSVEVATANSRVVRRMVRDGHSDIGLAAIDPRDSPEDDGVAHSIIWASEILVAVPADHRWAAQVEIDPKDFAQTRVIRSDPGANSSRVVAAALESIGLSQVAPLAEIGSTAAAIAMSLATGAPALSPDGTGLERGGLVVRRVRGLRFERQFALLVAGSLDLLSPPARFLAQHLLAATQRPSTLISSRALSGTPASVALTSDRPARSSGSPTSIGSSESCTSAIAASTSRPASTVRSIRSRALWDCAPGDPGVNVRVSMPVLAPNSV
jgi:DNA-binding transcriptional LysR family regulator